MPGGIRGFRIIYSGISPKMNVMVRLAFELVNFETVVQYFSHHTKVTFTVAFLSLHSGSIRSSSSSSLLLLLLFKSFESFSHQHRLIFFHWSLRDSKFPQVSRTLLNILADLNNAVIWMISTRPATSKSFSHFYQFFGDCTECASYNWHHRHIHIP